MKQQRHSVIRELLIRTAVTNQDDLRQKLAGRGFHVTQATLSRDIHELRLSKGPDGYSLPGGGDTEEDSLPGIREVLRSFGLEGRQVAHSRLQQESITKTGQRSLGRSQEMTLC